MLGRTAPAADIALDLGSARWRAALPGQGLVADAPAVVALDQRGDVIAEGDDAKRMLGRAPAGTRIIQPIRAGRVADPAAAERMLRGWLDRVLARSLRRPVVLLAVPAQASDLEQRAWRDLVLDAGGREVLLVARPLAAALGAGLPIDEPVGSCLVDIGEGHTEATVLALGGWVQCQSVPSGSGTIDQAIVRWLRRDAELDIGLPTAEQIKVGIGAAVSTTAARSMRVHGRDQGTHQVTELDVRTEQIVPWLKEPLGRIRQCLERVLADTPPELAADLVERGVLLTGGGARLRGMEDFFKAATGLPVTTADEPGRVVIHGLIDLFTDTERLERARVGL